MIKNTFQKGITGILFLIFIFSSINSNAQKHTISGYLEDLSSGERLIGAIIYDTISKNGIATNAYRYFQSHFPNQVFV